MHQSLLNQFRGAYLGAALGDVLGYGIFARDDGEGDTELALGEIALNYTQFLLAPSQSMAEQAGVNGPLLPLQAMAVQMALCLPGSVFFHEDLAEFQQQMTDQRSRWCPTLKHETSEELQRLDDAVLLLGLVLSLILQQQFHPSRAIALLRSILEDGGRSSTLLNYLTCLEQLLEQHQPLAIARLHLECVSPTQTPAQALRFTLVIALYLALSSLTDLPLTLRRLQALRPSKEGAALLEAWTLQRLLSFIAGMIGGAYNGLEGMPLAWRHCLTPGAYHQAQRVPPEVLEKNWKVGSEIELLQRVDSLFAHWSGVEQPGRFSDAMGGLAVLSPPTLLH